MYWRVVFLFSVASHHCSLFLRVRVWKTSSAWKNPNGSSKTRRWRTSTPVRPPLLRIGSSPLLARASPTEMKTIPSTPEESFRSKSPRSWTIQEVGSHMWHFPGGADNAEKFRDPEINGEALFLLTVGHLIRFMNIKLGHALKICDSINELCEQLQWGPDSAHYHLRPHFAILQCSHTAGSVGTTFPQNSVLFIFICLLTVRLYTFVWYYYFKCKNNNLIKIEAEHWQSILVHDSDFSFFPEVFHSLVPSLLTVCPFADRSSCVSDCELVRSVQKVTSEHLKQHLGILHTGIQCSGSIELSSFSYFSACRCSTLHFLCHLITPASCFKFRISGITFMQPKENGPKRHLCISGVLCKCDTS